MLNWVKRDAVMTLSGSEVKIVGATGGWWSAQAHLDGVCQQIEESVDDIECG